MKVTAAKEGTSSRFCKVNWCSIGKRTFGNVVASCKSKALLSSYPLSCRLRNAMLLRELETLSQIQLPDMLNLQLSYQQYPNVSIITLVSMSFDKS
jgi:hypothetical protein